MRNIWKNSKLIEISQNLWKYWKFKIFNFYRKSRFGWWSQSRKNYISLVFEKLAHSANFLMAKNFFKFIIGMIFVKVRKNLVIFLTRSPMDFFQNYIFLIFKKPQHYFGPYQMFGIEPVSANRAMAFHS
jgi:hypothetical protein